MIRGFAFFPVIGILLNLYLQAQHISMTPPQGWECIQDTEQLPKKVILVYIGSGNGALAPSLNVACEETTMTIKEYVTLAKAYHESEGDTRCSLLGTLETKAGTAHMLQVDRSTQWGNVRFIQAVLLRESMAYLITATCIQEEFSSLSSQFFKAIQSFTFIEPMQG